LDLRKAFLALILSPSECSPFEAVWLDGLALQPFPIVDMAEGIGDYVQDLALETGAGDPGAGVSSLMARCSSRVVVSMKKVISRNARSTIGVRSTRRLAFLARGRPRWLPLSGYSFLP